MRTRLREDGRPHAEGEAFEFQPVGVLGEHSSPTLEVGALFFIQASFVLVLENCLFSP